MLANQLLTISQAAKEAGTARSTIQRWIKSGRLKKRKAGKVSLRDVKACRDKQRTGRPHGQSDVKREIFTTDAQQEHGAVFCDGRRGLLRLKAILPGVMSYHIDAGRGDWITEILLDAAASKMQIEKTNEMLKRFKQTGRFSA
jgi:excisionase family DNA binding protein